MKPHHEILEILALTPFYLCLPPTKILNLPEHPPTPIYATLLKFYENLTPPLKCTLTQKGKDSFLKEQKILFPTMKQEHI